MNLNSTIWPKKERIYLSVFGHFCWVGNRTVRTEEVLWTCHETLLLRKSEGLKPLTIKRKGLSFPYKASTKYNGKQFEISSLPTVHAASICLLWASVAVCFIKSRYIDSSVKNKWKITTSPTATSFFEYVKIIGISFKTLSTPCPPGSLGSASETLIYWVPSQVFIFASGKHVLASNDVLSCATYSSDFVSS